MKFMFCLLLTISNPVANGAQFTLEQEITSASVHRPIAFHPRNPQLLLYKTRSSLHLYDLSAKRDTWSVDSTDESTAIFSDDGEYVVDGFSRNEIAIIRCETGETVSTLALPRGPEHRYSKIHGLALNPEQTQLFVAFGQYVFSYDLSNWADPKPLKGLALEGANWTSNVFQFQNNHLYFIDSNYIWAWENDLASALTKERLPNEVSLVVGLRYELTPAATLLGGSYGSNQADAVVWYQLGSGVATRCPYFSSMMTSHRSFGIGRSVVSTSDGILRLWRKQDCKIEAEVYTYSTDNQLFLPWQIQTSISSNRIAVGTSNGPLLIYRLDSVD